MRSKTLAFWLLSAAQITSASSVTADSETKQYPPSAEEVIDESCNLSLYGPDAPTSRDCELSKAAINAEEVLIKTDQGTFAAHANDVDVNKVSLEG